MSKMIKEGKALIKLLKAEEVSKRMPVFYNPEMRLNRDLTVLLLKVINKKNMVIADPLAGTGIRSIRLLKELKGNKVKRVFINDSSKKAANLIKRNLKLNKIKSKAIVSNEDANIFLLKSKGFDYIDIDPFGYPGIFLAAAMQRLARNGILAVTATDKAALAGNKPKACIRKYWAKPLKNSYMHETGLRILIRFVQLIGAQHEKALTPIFSYSEKHYARAFFLCQKGRKRVDEIIKKHGFIENCYGPAWRGELWNKKLVKSILKKSDKNTEKIMRTISQEAKINVLGFYDLHWIGKKNKLRIPPNKAVIKELKKMGFRVAETHFSPVGIRSNAPLRAVIKAIKKTKNL